MTSGRSRAITFLRILAVLACVCDGALAADAQHAYPKLFGTNETRSDSIKIDGEITRSMR